MGGFAPARRPLLGRRLPRRGQAPQSGPELTTRPEESRVPIERAPAEPLGPGVGSTRGPMDEREPEPSRREAERLTAALTESEGRFQRLVEALQVGVVIQGPRSEILFANPAAADLLDVPLPSLVGKTSMEASRFAIHEDGTPFPGEDHPRPR